MHRLTACLAILLGVLGCDTPPGDDASAYETRITTEDGIGIHVRVVGFGPDTVVIPGAVYLAEDLLPLVSGRTLIFYDPRGRGASESVDDTMRIGIDFDVADLEAVRRHFRLGEFSLVGWSYLGAMVALYAARNPGGVKRIVQIGPMPPRPVSPAVTEPRGTPPDSAELEYLANLREHGVEEDDPEGYCREWLRYMGAGPMMALPDALSDARMDPCIYPNEWPDRVMATLGRIRTAIGPDWDYSTEAALVRVPVLTIHGMQDPVPVEGGRDWVSLLPNARLVELEGVGHLPWLEAPAEFFREVEAFL